MIGFFLNNAAHLVTLNLAHSVYRVSRFAYEADGCGATLGQYLLAEHTTPSMDKTLAATAAVYIVELVKRHDAMCGGPTRVSMLYNGDPFPAIGTFSQESIDRCAKRLADADDKNKPQQRKMFQDLANECGFSAKEMMILD